MKRLAILFIILIILLCGCKPSANNASDPTETTPLAPSVTGTQNTEGPTSSTIPVYSQLPMTAVSLPATTEYTMAEDGTVIFRYTHQNIHLVVQDQEIADRLIIDFLNRKDEYNAVAEYYNEQAKNDYSAGDWSAYFCETLFNPTRVDGSVLSLFGIHTFYGGGNHPEYECIGANYNMVTGDVLTLGSILYNIDSLAQLRDLVISEAEQIAEASNLYDDYTDIVHQRFQREESFDEDWFFTNTGLAFYFAPYEIAPYRSGVITVEVPYSRLAGIIADEFFPPEEDYSEGTITAELLSEADLDTFTQIAELIIDAEGEHIFLYCDGLIRDVRVDVGSWSADGTQFTTDYTAFATQTLSPGDGVTIQAVIPDVMPTLCVSYRSGDEHIRLFLSQSGKDGTILLITP